MKKKTFSIILLLLIFSLALFFRIYFSYDRVFSEPIKYAADDGIYHMRLVENELLGGHFPQRIYFDPYTYFPYGSYIHFAPLYDQLLAGIIWIISLGAPSLKLINKIAPFYPAVLGSLMVFLVYFIARALWGRRVAFFSAFLIAICPSFLYRSLLGTTDHHVAEVLFSTLAMMFLILTLKARKKQDQDRPGRELKKPSAFNIIKRGVGENKKFWLFVFLTGLSLGLYFLTWNGALLFLFITFVFISFYYLTEYISGRFPAWILFIGIVIFLIVLLMIAPLFGHPDLFHANMYNIQHLGTLILGILGFLALGGLAKFMTKKRINRKLFPIFLIFGIILFLVILRFVFPSLFGELVKIFRAVKTGMVSHELAREIISEMAPLQLKGAFDSFSFLFYFSLIALAIIFYQFIKKRKPEHLLLFVWTFIMILMTGVIPLFGQKRFTYYLSCNISLLAGFLIVKGFEFGWRGLRISQRISLNPSIKPYFLIGTILIIFNVVFFVVFPFPLNIDESFPANLPRILQLSLTTAKAGTFIVENDWYETWKWLRENTPDPGVDYYALYQEPGINKETAEFNPYPYSERAYGVLARWDVGHMITYYAHRIPNANPFQQGVGRKKGEEMAEIGETVFFLESNEEKAIGYLEKLRTRYIITDYPSADPQGIFRSKVKWAQGDLGGYSPSPKSLSSEPTKFDNSMIARLHFLDGRGKIIEREVGGEKIDVFIKPLNHFRLVYESSTTASFSREDPKDETKFVKIFEYVKGAKIKGQGKSGDKITISTEIETNQGKRFVYQKSVEVENGYFEFIVPYSTFGKRGWLEGQTKFAVFAQPYNLKIEEKEIEINVSEENVLRGETIRVDNK